MPGFGTIVNVTALIAGGLLGLVIGNRFPERMQDTLVKGLGGATMFMGISGTMQKMLYVNPDGTLGTQKTLMMIVCIALGAAAGELLDIDGRLESFGAWLKVKSGSSGDSGFIDAFVTSSLTVAIGAMAVIGSINDGIMGDHTLLYIKAILDFVFIMVMTTAMGKGCIFAAIPVGVFQGSITILAGLLEPVFTTAALDNLSLVGGVLIFFIGVNLIFGKKVRVANLLPAIAAAVIAAFLPFTL